MGRRRGKSRRRAGGHVVEMILNGILVLIVLLFGVSIAARWGGDERPGGAEDQARVDPVSLPVVPPDASEVDGLRGRPTVVIKNGCGEQGLAEEMTQILRRSGFDVVDYGNAGRYDHETTLVIDRSGQAEMVSRLQLWLGREYGVGTLKRDVAPVPGADMVLGIGRDLADTLQARETRESRGDRVSRGR